MGEHLTFKALVGTASLEADARAAGGSSASGGDEQEDWFAASRRPAPTEATGALPACGSFASSNRVTHRALACPPKFVPTAADTCMLPLLQSQQM